MADLRDEVGQLQQGEWLRADPAGRDADLEGADQKYPVDLGQVAKADHAAHSAVPAWALLEELESVAQPEQEPQAWLPQAELKAVALAASRE